MTAGRPLPYLPPLPVPLSYLQLAVYFDSLWLIPAWGPSSFSQCSVDELFGVWRVT